VELAGSLVALVDWFERRAGCESARLSSFKSTRPPPLIGMTFHGLASNAVTNDSAKTPPSAVSRKCSNPNTVVARAGEFGKRPHTPNDSNHI